MPSRIKVTPEEWASLPSGALRREQDGLGVQTQPPSLACNLCQKALATTCFKCACDCIFCEVCTYSHFEQSSQCPTCRRTLNENDFLELVVTDTSGTDSILKTTMQHLFSKKGSSGTLQYSDLCQSLINELDTAKINAEFLLKQMRSMSAQASACPLSDLVAASADRGLSDRGRELAAKAATTH